MTPRLFVSLLLLAGCATSPTALHCLPDLQPGEAWETPVTFVCWCRQGERRGVVVPDAAGVFHPWEDVCGR